MHGLVNTDDETVVLRVWGNSFAMAISPLLNCFMSSSTFHYKEQTSHNQTLNGIVVF